MSTEPERAPEPEQWPEPFELTMFGDGQAKRVDWKTRAALEEAERQLGYPLTLAQGSYNGSPDSDSPGTHDGGGVIDLPAWDWQRKVRALRSVGFAAWYRPAVKGLWEAHIHAVLIDHGRLAPVAAGQVAGYRAGRDGLKSNRPDEFWRPSPIPVFRYPPNHPPTTSASPSRQNEPTLARIGSIDGAGNDRVGDSDQLGFEPYVLALADLITSPHSRPPLTIGIFGSWGIGKSFLLKAIETEIGERRKAEDLRGHQGSPPRVHVVSFNAWEYSATETVWPALVRKIVKTLDEEVQVSRRTRYATRLRWNLSRSLSGSWQAITAATLVGVAAIAVALWRERTLAAGTIAAVILSFGLAGLVRAASNPLARWVTALFADSDYGRQIGFMEEIQHDLETLEARLHHGDDPNGPVESRILVLIDDLDRCEPDKAVAVLQAVNLLLNFESFIVCLGIDARVTTAAIEKHYEGLLGTAGASGYEYLDKIVQIPFRIPEPNAAEIKEFFALQLGVQDDGFPSGQAEEAEEPDGRPLVDADTLAESSEVGSGTRSPVHSSGGVPFTKVELTAFEQLVPHMRPNPRHLKRLVNVYRLVRALARQRNEPAILDNPAATIRWLVMWSQWPYTSRMMLDRLDELLAGATDSSTVDDDVDVLDDPETDPLINLLAEVSPRLDPEIRSRLDYHAEALNALLAVDDCRLTEREIQRVRRYTFNFNPAVEEYVRAVAGPHKHRLE